MFNPLALFSTLKSGVITVAVVATMTFVGVLWFQKNAAERAVVELQVQNSNLQTKVAVKELEVENLHFTIDVLEKSFAEIAEAVEVENENEERINNAPPEDDGTVSPVLRDTLDSLGRMHGHSKD